jgi:tRNA(Arg) A34 adenosine deaminase TadA
MDRTSTDITIDAIDHAMMERCIALAMRAMDHGEYPYAAVISRNRSRLRIDQFSET